MELTPKESGGLRRMDVREVGAIARSLSRFPLQAAFRFNRRPGDAPKLQLEWTQFPDSSVLSAVAERATITTLTNIEGKSLTEVTLRVRNHAQPFVKVELPAGAQLLSAEVAGERVKPVMGADGSRVPLLRVGFNPSGAYTVSFVYLSSGTRFAKNGVYDMTLPKLDIPGGVMTWDVASTGPGEAIWRQCPRGSCCRQHFRVLLMGWMITTMVSASLTDNRMDWKNAGRRSRRHRGRSPRRRGG